MVTLDELDRQLAELGRLLGEQAEWSTLPVPTNMGLWQWLPDSGTIQLSTAWADLLGVERCEEPVPLARYLDFVHPQDRPFVAYAMADCICSGKPYRSSHRILRNGNERHFLGRDVAVFSAHGHPVRVIGADVDVT